MAPSADPYFRAFRTRDLDAVGPWLRDAGWGVPESMSHKVWGQRVEQDPRIVCRVACLGNQAVGLYRLDLAPDHDAELTIVVAPGSRRRGIGLAILAAAQHQARQLELRGIVALVQRDNWPGRHFFAKAGFVSEPCEVPGHVRFRISVWHQRPVNPAP